VKLRFAGSKSGSPYLTATLPLPPGPAEPTVFFAAAVFATWINSGTFSASMGRGRSNVSEPLSMPEDVSGERHPCSERLLNDLEATPCHDANTEAVPLEPSPWSPC